MLNKDFRFSHGGTITKRQRFIFFLTARPLTGKTMPLRGSLLFGSRCKYPRLCYIYLSTLKRNPKLNRDDRRPRYFLRRAEMAFEQRSSYEISKNTHVTRCGLSFGHFCIRERCPTGRRPVNEKVRELQEQYRRLLKDEYNPSAVEPKTNGKPSFSSEPGWMESSKKSRTEIKTPRIRQEKTGTRASKKSRSGKKFARGRSVKRHQDTLQKKRP